MSRAPSRFWSLQQLAIDQAGPAVGIVVVFSSLALVSVRLVKADRAGVLGFHVEPDGARASIPRRLFNPAQQLGACAEAAQLRQNLDRLDVCSEGSGIGNEIGNRETGDLALLLGNPGNRAGALRDATQIPSGKPQGRLKADFL